MTVQEKLSAIRKAMQDRQLAAYIIPSGDPHQSEYVAAHWKSRQWISGFTGSAGTVVITHDHAGLWTDSRYFIQAEEQLKGSPVELHKLGIPHTPEHLEWLQDNLPAGSKVGLDGRLFSVGQVRKMAKHFYDKKIGLDTHCDLVGQIWRDRPPLPQTPVFEHDIIFAVVSRSEKIQIVREKMTPAGYYFLSTLDDIAWLFNLRGQDVECNPVFYAYALIGKDVVWLFIETAKVPEELKATLNQDGIIVKPYQEIEDFLKKLSREHPVLVDPGSTSNQVFSSVLKESVKETENLIAPLKAIKNPTEIAHFKNVMVRDGVALVRMFRWLEETLEKRAVPETEVAEKLIECRREQGHYVGESFDAIVGYNGNGAIVHYRPEHGSCANITPEGILLVDSGGQYFDGTTDITRTIALGKPTKEQKTDFTLVLKGHIALNRVRFPKGTTGVQLDTLARMFLWQRHLNYGHGTGHGVGFFLNVHEPPQGFSPAVNTPRANIAFEPGMLTSNEPGLYKAGKYGIRTENLILCVEDGENDFGNFYRFENITLFPIDLRLIKKSMLSKREKRWLNNYHKEVFEKLSPHLNEEETEWLAEKCEQI
jgi:Xaa-Pro aminopeptidase